jgi:hypothetical protein
MRHAPFWAGLFCLVAVAGCGRSNISFNNALSEANQRIAKGGEAWANAAVAAMEGDAAAVQRFKSAEQDLRKVLADVKSDMQALKVPDSPTAKRLYDAHQKFLQGQDEIINNQFAEIGRLIEDPDTPQMAKMQKFVELAQSAEARENQDLVVLQQVQREFAQENGFRLQEP